MRTVFFIIVNLFLSFRLFSQSPDSITPVKMYHINHYISTGMIAAGLISDYYAIPRIIGKPNITNDELHAINPSILNTIDKWALRQNPADRTKFKKLSDIIQVPIYFSPCLLAFDKTIRKDWFDLLLMYAQGHTITFSFYNYSFLGPTFQNRLRPMAYYSYFTDEARESGNNRNSFYSGHVASCSYSSFFMAKVYCDYHPNIGNKKYLVYTAALIPPAVMGYLRVKSLDHFPSDDAVGLLLGAVIGIVIPELHKHSLNKNLAISPYSSENTAGLSVRWTFKKNNIFIPKKNAVITHGNTKNITTDVSLKL